MSQSTYNLSKFAAKILRDRSLTSPLPFTQFLREQLESPEFQDIISILEGTPTHKQKEVYTSLKPRVEVLSGNSCWQGRPVGSHKAAEETQEVSEASPEPEVQPQTQPQEVTVVATAIADDEELPAFGPLPSPEPAPEEVKLAPKKRGRKPKVAVVQDPQEEVTVSND